ncbi:ParB-like nuclease domain protein [Gordonia phage Clawz]|uniref:ParB-like nuclease domain protein n=1 Tax=Gordonia phage Clawz TaxID=2743910 RepID=A0AAE7K787_9CAUD|nr:ParB-like nuclease domain protein [Gordonia phage Clawz]QKY79942.1 ParB-like nuclease domain protein [Gordonia phage Clawz]
MEQDEVTEPTKLNPRIATRNPRDLTLLEVNAHYMTKEKFDALVANIRRDGALTSLPLVYADPDNEREIVLSGNHRTQAAIEAELDEIQVMLIDQKLSRQQQVAIQLSHNSIFGEDDPSTLAMLYNELDDVDWRAYSGLDDKSLDLLDESTTLPMSEVNLSFNEVSFVFLPPELEAAEQAFEEARRFAGAKTYWLAEFEQYDAMMKALDTARKSYNVGNKATALAVILNVFESHLTELQDGWLDEHGEPRDSGKKATAPIETVFGTRSVRVGAANVIRQAMAKAKDAGDLPESADPWSFMEMLAQNYVLGAAIEELSDDPE